ncbi:winged helix-turn-helix domain-containing protein [Baekduia soli]|uniref:Winged helix-turn-helix domain-containing protein n=1 Tax=Baekduia soli TaxID=496014 RepID=A0A5B8U930_9ACTN|nr:winged helix-turn-helix domain-containing protein [Baekduia soli]
MLAAPAAGEGRAISRQALVHAAWARGAIVHDNTIDVCVAGCAASSPGWRGRGRRGAHGDRRGRASGASRSSSTCRRSCASARGRSSSRASWPRGLRDGPGGSSCTCRTAEAGPTNATRDPPPGWGPSWVIASCLQVPRRRCRAAGDHPAPLAMGARQRRVTTSQLRRTSTLSAVT